MCWISNYYLMALFEQFIIFIARGSIGFERRLGDHLKSLGE